MKKALMALVLIGASVIVYRHCLSGQFVYDDRAVIETNPLIREIKNIPVLFQLPYWATNAWQRHHRNGGLYRPVTMTTYALNYRLGGLNPRGYHAANLALHIGVCFLLWLFCVRLGIPATAGYLAALFFALLPVHTEAVSNVVGRAELLSTFFGLLAWITVIKKTTYAHCLAGGLCFIAAVLCKENAAALLPAMIYMDVATRPALKWTKYFQNRARVWVIFAGFLALYLQWRLLLIGPITAPGGIQYFQTTPLLVRLLTMADFFFSNYLRPMLLGVGLCAEYSRPSVTDASPSHFSSWMAALALFVMMASSIYFSLSRRRSVFARYTVVFLILLLPVANVLFSLEVIGAERFLYFPSVSYAILLGIGGHAWVASKGGMRRPGLAMVGLLLAWYGWQTDLRDAIWKSEETFWTQTVKDAPLSPRAWNGMGVSLMHQQRYPEAISHFEKAIALNPRIREAHYNIAESYFFMGEYAKAKFRFLDELKSNPSERDCQMYLALIAEKEKKYADAAAWYHRVLIQNPLDRTAQKNLALTYCRMGETKNCRSGLEYYLMGEVEGETNDEIREFLMTLKGKD